MGGFEAFSSNPGARAANRLLTASRLLDRCIQSTTDTHVFATCLALAEPIQCATCGVVHRPVLLGHCQMEICMQRTTEYFEERGQANTERTLELARQRAREAGIGTIVLASTRGYTAGKALEACTDFDLIAVGIERDRFPAEQADRFQRTGKLIFSREVGYEYPPEMQRAFRRFGQGTKVAVEVVVCAVQAGLVKVGERVIGVGGSSRGADTALVIGAFWDFSDIHISEIICKPA